MSKQVLVTGAGGFLGKYVARRLVKRGYAVRSLSRSVAPDMGMEHVQGSVVDYPVVERAMEGVDAVFHIAAKAGVWGKYEDFYKTNVQGTVNLLHAAKKEGVEHFIYTSTPSVVYTGGPIRGGNEAMPYGDEAFVCDYAKTKAMAEEAVLKSNEIDGMKTVALRPHLIWGVGDNHIVPRILERARAGRLKRVGSGDNFVDITHVENAAEAHILALDALERGKAAGKAYFISQGEPVNLWSWVNELLRRLHAPEVSGSISYKNAYRMGGVLEFFHRVLGLEGEPRMTRFVATELAKDHYFDISRAREDLGYAPLVSTEAGMDALAEDYLRRG